MLKALAKTPPYAIFSDSLEVYNADWTGDFLEEFRKAPRLRSDALPAGSGRATSARRRGAIRHDWGKTLTRTGGATIT